MALVWSGEQWVSSPDAVHGVVPATRAGLVTDEAPMPAHLAELVPDAPRVALPVPAAED